MKVYSKLQISFISVIISIIIYIFFIEYLPKLYKVGKTYIYYKSQPNIIQEYEN